MRRILSTYAVSLGARIAVIIGDILVLAFTWFKTFRHRMNVIRVGVQTPMSALLLRDGPSLALVLELQASSFSDLLT